MVEHADTCHAPVASAVFDSDDRFYRAVPQVWFNIDTGYIARAAFRDFRMSVDWAARCSAEESRARWPAIKPKGIVRFGKSVCDATDQVCEYTPVPPTGDSGGNSAHCEIVGDKPTAVRDAFASASKIVLGCPE